MSHKDDPIKKDSIQLSWLLRHGAAEEGLEVDAAGWVQESEVLRYLRWTPERLGRVVADNNKQRFEQHQGRIRATQGHSSAMPITLDAMESSWVTHEGLDSLWHGTTLTALPQIMAEGIHSAARTHVHLAAATDSHVGKRSSGIHVLIEVSAAKLRAKGFEVFCSPNGVVLAREVPVDCIVGLQPTTRAAKAASADWATRWPGVRVHA